MLKILFLLLTSLLSINALAIDPYTFIPKKSSDYLPLLVTEQQRLLPNMSTPWYFAGLIEQESCITLTHSKCWDPRSRLKSAREEGAGLLQITRAYKEDGVTVRFDSLSDMARLHKAELKEMTWSNIYQRPDLQVRTIVLMIRDNDKALYAVTSEEERLNMADAAYNGGLAGVFKQRRLCGLAAKCDPQIWFDNVANICVKSLKPLYAGKNACQINTLHVSNVVKIRMTKYKPYFK